MAVDTQANALMTSLLAGEDFTIPNVDTSGPEFTFPGSTDLYQQVSRLAVTDVTDGTVGGLGAFDKMMTSLKAHLREEYDAGRITGDQYAKAYIAMTEGAMANMTQFVLNREKTFWEAVIGQMNAIIARHDLEIRKVELEKEKLEAATVKVNFARTKIDLALAEVNYDTGVYNLGSILPASLAKTSAETSLLGQQELVAAEQVKLVSEQFESQRANTLDTRSDNVTAVVGQIGKQKDLYTQQITSYQRDSEVKAAKLFSDAWITQKTIDEGLTAPTGFTNASLDDVLTVLKTNNSLIPPP